MIEKFADDTVLAGFLTGPDSEVAYDKAIQDLISWCDNNYLHLNTSKTKELIIDFRRQQTLKQPKRIKLQSIEQVHEYKYLGTIIDDNLSWNSNTDHIYKKSQQRLHFLRCLRQFNVDTTLMTLFYQTFIFPILCFNLLSWFGNLSVQNRNKLFKITNVSSKIAGTQLDSLSTFYTRQMIKKANKIIKDTSHTLHSEYKNLRSGKRLRSIASKTNRTLNSFVPKSIRMLNAK